MTMEKLAAEIAEKNVRTTYLTGLGIEITPVAGTGNFLVSIRWDDYDITDDCRWTGDIVLKDTAILAMGKTITLAQNRTVAQTTRDAETGLFADRTRWTCEAGSYLRQENASTIRLTEGSSLVFESGSRFVQAFDASMEVGAVCTLRFVDAADVVLRGILEVDSGGVCYMTDTIGMGATARIIVRPGGKLVVDGGTLTDTSILGGSAERKGDASQRRRYPYFRPVLHVPLPLTSPVDSSASRRTRAGRRRRSARWCT